jgi:transposase
MPARERVEADRLEWLLAIGLLDPRRFVFVDETGTHIGMARVYARALRGERAVNQTVRNRGGAFTLISALSPSGVQADMVIPGAVTGEVFVAFVREALVPTLQAGQVVILDRLGAHRRPEVRTLIEAARCELVFLPSYSPDFNPIEFAFSWLKARLRSVGARSVRVLLAGIGRASAMIDGVLAGGWFAGCGYIV